MRPENVTQKYSPKKVVADGGLPWYSPQKRTQDVLSETCWIRSQHRFLSMAIFVPPFHSLHQLSNYLELAEPLPSFPVEPGSRGKS